MSSILGIGIAEIVASLSVSIGIALILSVIRDYLNKKAVVEIKIGEKIFKISDVSDAEIQKIFDEIENIKQSPQAFIIYSHDEKELARKISHDLQEAGIKIWLDEQQLKIGDSLSEKIKSALNESQWIIFLPPKEQNYKDSWVSKEIRIAQDSEKWRGRHLIIPIKTDKGVMPDILKDRVWVDFTEDYDKAINNLIKGILRNEKHPYTAELAREEKIEEFIEV